MTAEYGMESMTAKQGREHVRAINRGATIIEQMGGFHRLHAMINLREAITTDNGVRFRFSGCQKANVATVDLNPMDTYDVALWDLNNVACDRITSVTDIYGDNLKEAFESLTGLRLSL